MKHCIIAKFNEDIDAAKKAALLPEITAVFKPLEQMEGIHGVEVIPNVIDRPNRYDVMIRIDMDPEVLSAYDASEPHHTWKNNYGSMLAKKCIFDYE